MGSFHADCSFSFASVGTDPDPPSLGRGSFVGFPSASGDVLGYRSCSEVSPSGRGLFVGPVCASKDGASASLFSGAVLALVSSIILAFMVNSRI